MKYTMQKSWYLIVAALFFALLTTGPLAAQTATFNLTSSGSGEIVWGSSYGIYTSPYSGDVNGGSTIPVICDDFADNSYVPESWTAYVTQASSLTSGTTDTNLKWSGAAVGGTQLNSGTAYSLNQDQAYTVAAVLAVDILDNQGPANVLAEQEYSFAMWALFDPGAALNDQTGALGWLNSNGYPSTTVGGFYQQVVTDLNNAASYALKPANANPVQADVNAVTIYSYDSAAGVPTGACGGPCPAPQEFLTVNMAEPPSSGLLALDLLGVAGLILFVRRRRTCLESLNRS